MVDLRVWRTERGDREGVVALIIFGVVFVIFGNETSRE